MNIAIICNVSTQKPIGVIGIDKENGNVAFISKNKDLEDILERISSKESLELMIEEKLNDSCLLRVENVDFKSSNYLVALDNHLPYPWKILGVTYVEQDLEQSVEEIYNYMEGFENE